MKIIKVLFRSFNAIFNGRVRGLHGIEGSK
jgi:hypothetical protein